VGVACDLGYPCAKFRLPRPFGFRVRADVRDIRRIDGRTTDADHRIMPPRRGHNNEQYAWLYASCPLTAALKLVRAWVLWPKCGPLANVNLLTA